MKRDDWVLGFVIGLLVVIFEVGYWIQITQKSSGDVSIDYTLGG